MSRGFTEIALLGGIRDGEIIEDVPLNKLPNSIHFNSETFFTANTSGEIELCKGKLNSFWYSFSQDIYLKTDNEKYKRGVIFKFSGTVIVDRCEAITKAGKRCMKPAIYGKTYCSSTHQPK